MSSFAAELAPEARAKLTPDFPSEWTGDTLASAPSTVAALARRCGGLREGQLLLCGDAVAGGLVFALWWPWGDGSKVSVRIGIESAEHANGLTPRLREVFGAA